MHQAEKRANGYKIDIFDKDVANIIFDQFELKVNATEKSVQLMNIIKSACGDRWSEKVKLRNATNLPIDGTTTLQTLEKNAWTL